MSGMPPAAVWGRSAERIESGHRDRSAIVYVRQSSRQQVLDHSESTRLQYALVERVVALGWARSRVLVIDDDLGVSAAVADSRAGFARLVTEVTMGRAGLVLGIEMSRLARTVYVPKISSVLVGRGLVRRFVAASDQRVFSASSAWVGDDCWLCWSGSHIWQ